MVVTAPVSLDDYLDHPTEPESELFEGELIQKAMGTTKHSRLQAKLVHLLMLQLQSKGLDRVATEQSVLVREGVVFIPDVCILQPGTPDGKVATIPPTLCIEILSPSDRFSYTVRKCDEFLNFGVQACWIFDPEAERVWVASPGGLSEAPRESMLRLEGIALALTDVFSLE